MRALLVVNHKATTTSARVRDVLVQALRSVTDLRVEHTKRRGHAAELGRQATADGLDVVVALGGDGTVNEIINGLLSDGIKPDNPAFAVVPGGSTNVFARSLGLPRDWVEATGVLLEALRDKRERSIGLGRAGGRYFTFCAGLGLDASVVHRVERARLRGRTSTPLLYLRSLGSQYLWDTRRGESPITLEIPGEPPTTDLATVIVQNTAPWTYLGDRPVHGSPDASFDLGLDLLAMRALHVPSTARTMIQLVAGRTGRGEEAGKLVGPHGRQVVRGHDLAEFTLRATAPMAFQLDGDYLGERDEVHFASAPAALRVIC
jgi:diacylglycerol kinase family enzyme